MRDPPARYRGATEAAPSGRRLGSWLAIIALCGVLVAFLAPSAVLAQSAPMKLALRPVGQPGSYFDLIMLPGETRSLAVDIANDGDALKYEMPPVLVQLYYKTPTESPKRWRKDFDLDLILTLAVFLLRFS